MNDVCRARPRSPSNSNLASLVNVCRSGQKRMWVPVLPFATRLPLRVRPDLGVNFAVRAISCEHTGHAAAEAQPLLARRPVHVDVHPRRQRIDDREADTVEATGGDVRAAAELAAGVQLGRHDLDPGETGLGLVVGRDPPPVVVDLDRVVGVKGHLDPVGRAGERLVDPVVDDLPEAVHETAGVGGADVHSGPLADGLEALEDQQVCGVVGVVGDRGAPAARKSVRTAGGCRSESTRDTPRPDAGTPGRSASRCGHDRCSIRPIRNQVEDDGVKLDKHHMTTQLHRSLPGVPTPWEIGIRGRTPGDWMDVSFTTWIRESWEPSLGWMM